jgi:hypothetical protein
VPEHRRRLDSGEAFAVLAEEARYLREVWLPQKNPRATVPSQSTIENAISVEHRRTSASRASRTPPGLHRMLADGTPFAATKAAATA